MRRLQMLVLTALLAAVCGGGSAVARNQAWQPPGNTIVKITGDRDNGFTVKHYDGSTLFPPTASEARTECEEYDTRVRRVRCRTEVRTWYRDLGATKRAIRYARTQQR